MAEGGRTNDEPTLLERAIWSVLVEIFTVLPGEVVSFDSDRRLADVQPSIKTKDSEGNVESRPQVVNVPVIFLSGGGFVSSVDLSEGDSVAIIWSQRSIDRWQELAREVDPQDGRAFHASDAFCIPGPQPKTAASAIKENAAFFGLEDLSAGLTVNDDGSIVIERDGVKALQEIEEKAASAASALGTLKNTKPVTAVTTANSSGTGVWQNKAKTAIGDAQSALDNLSSKISQITP